MIILETLFSGLYRPMLSYDFFISLQLISYLEHPNLNIKYILYCRPLKITKVTTMNERNLRDYI